MAISPFPVTQGRREWVDGGRRLWMTLLCLPFLEGSHFSDRNIKKSLIYIKISEGRAEGLPWLHSGMKGLQKGRKYRAESCRTLLHCPPLYSYDLRVVVGPYTSLSSPTCRHCVLCIIFGPYALSLGHTRCRWALCVVVGSSYRGWGLQIVLLANFKQGQRCPSPSPPTCRG